MYRTIEEVGHRGDAPRAVAIGTFDGFHLGHRAIISKAVLAARAMQGTACVLTFEPHPSAILDPQNQPARLCTFEQKVSLLEEAGVDEVVALPFDRAFAALSAAQFSDLVLSKRLNARQVLVGENFRFGHRGSGTAEDLLAFGRARGFSVTAIGLVIASGRPVSSTRIRALIAEGRVEDAATLLGRPHALDGIVEGGAGRGRDLGSPTANLSVPVGSAVPGVGVYVTRTTVALGDVRASVTSIGTNPTFESDDVLRIETFILDFEGDLYGRPERVEFLAWVRAQRTFADPSALRRRITEDVKAARDYFATMSKDGVA